MLLASFICEHQLKLLLLRVVNKQDESIPVLDCRAQAQQKLNGDPGNKKSEFLCSLLRAWVGRGEQLMRDDQSLVGKRSVDNKRNRTSEPGNL